MYWNFSFVYLTIFLFTYVFHGGSSPWIPSTKILISLLIYYPVTRSFGGFAQDVYRQVNKNGQNFFVDSL